MVVTDIDDTNGRATVSVIDDTNGGAIDTMDKITPVTNTRRAAFALNKSKLTKTLVKVSQRVLSHSGQPCVP